MLALAPWPYRSRQTRQLQYRYVRWCPLEAVLLLAPQRVATALLCAREPSLGAGLRLLKDAGVSLTFCEEQLMDGALFAQYESAVAVTAGFARLACVSHACRRFADAALPAGRRKLASDGFLLMCRQLTAAAESANPASQAVRLQLAEVVGDAVVASINRYVAERSPALYLTKMQLRESALYQLHLACSAAISRARFVEDPRYAMTTVTDVRVLALVYDALIEEEEAGEDGLEAGNQGMAVGAAMFHVPLRTSAVRAAIASITDDFMAAPARLACPQGVHGKEITEQDLVGMQAQALNQASAKAQAGNQAGGLRPCEHCGAREVQKKQFKLCSACKGVVFCSRDCQLANWPSHKAACKAACKAAASKGAAGGA